LIPFSAGGGMWGWGLWFRRYINSEEAECEQNEANTGAMTE
jgi:hypothetical protein